MNSELRTLNPSRPDAAAFKVQRSTFEVQSSVPGREWLLLDSGAGDPAGNMALDEALLEAMPRLWRPVLRFYGWTKPAASFGYFQKYAEVERATPLRPLLRRPTGGGLVPHDVDWTYSLVFPAGHEWHLLKAAASYRRVHEWLQNAFTGLKIHTELAAGRCPSGLGQCFAGYERFDLLCGGRKIAGAAQRRTRDGLLIQGSVRPVVNSEGHPLAADSPSRAEWQRAMCAVAGAQGIAWTDFEPDAGLSARAAELEARKYASMDYNRKR